MSDASGDKELSNESVQRVAKLARLAISPEQVVRYRGQLGAILAYVEQLGALNLEGVEPMASPLDMYSPMREDVAGRTLGNDVLMKMAPEKFEPFIRVPKVMGDGGGA